MKNLIVFALVVLALLVAACATPTPTPVPPTQPPAPTTAPAPTQPPAPTQAPAPTKAPEPTKVPEFNWKQRSGEKITIGLAQHPWTTAIQPFFPEFEQLTGIKVEYQTFAEAQLRDKMLIMLQAKSGEIDLWPTLKSREGLKYYRAGYYEPLDKYLNNPKLTPPDFDRKGIGAGPLGGETFDGKIVGLPTIVEGPAIFYRKDLFEKAGIKPPKTMDEIATAAAACMKAAPTGTYGVTTRGAPAALPYTFGPFLRNYGTDWRDKSGKSQLSSPAGLKAINAYVNLVKNYGPPGFVTYSFPQESALMAAGNVCMEIEATNEISTIIDPKNSKVVGKVGVVPYPPGPDGRDVPTVLQWGNSINAFSQHKEAAWLFMVWSTSPQMQAKLQVKGIASPRSASWDTPEWKAKVAEDPIWSDWTATLKHIVEKGSGDVGTPGVEQPAIRQIIGDAIDAVYLGQKSAEEAAKEADAKLDAMEH
ncbi:MAG: sugar ABC transporter substrate-binding protein [Chloroflexota bacterium]